MSEQIIPNMTTNIVEMSAQEKPSDAFSKAKTVDISVSQVEMPSPSHGPLCWSGTDFKDSTSHIWTLGQSDVKEIDNALENFKSKSHLPIARVEYSNSLERSWSRRRTGKPRKLPSPNAWQATRRGLQNHS